MAAQIIAFPRLAANNNPYIPDPETALSCPLAWRQAYAALHDLPFVLRRRALRNAGGR